MSLRTGLTVMKFGGTSVEDAAAMGRSREIVASRQARGQQVVVVVSAMAGVTDQLHAAAVAAGNGDKAGALAMSARLRHRHLEAARDLFGEDKHGAAQWLDAEFVTLDELLRGIAAVGELTPRTLDLVLSYGERVSSRLIAETYAAQSLHAVHVDARQCIVTDEQFGRALPRAELLAVKTKELLAPLLADGNTPVLGGFIGSTESGATTTLGRGGSDYTAALLGGALGADAIEIWTDVNGIMTADPRICPDAMCVRHISFQEAAELAYFGAKVLHPATILPAIEKNIPVWVLNSKSPASAGTKITALPRRSRSPFKSIAVKPRVTILDIVASRMLMSHGYLRRVFEIFDHHKCVVDLVSTSEVSISLTVDSNAAIPAIAADLGKIADVKYEGRKALVCLVGDDIRGQKGIAGRVFSAIPDVNVRMISQGASEINLSFVIDEDDVEAAVRELHAAFFSEPDPEIFDVGPRRTK